MGANLQPPGLIRMADGDMTDEDLAEDDVVDGDARTQISRLEARIDGLA